MTREEIKKSTVDTINTASKIFNKNFQVDEIQFTEVRSKHAGMHICFKKPDETIPHAHVLKFNLLYAKHFSKEYINTIIHEVAHLVDTSLNGINRANRHSKTWEEIMRTLDAPANKFHSYVLPEKETKVKVEKVKIPKGEYVLPAVKTREAATIAGDVLYWSGKECEKGHKAPRYTRDNVCKECYRLKRLELKAKQEKMIEERNAKLAAKKAA